MALLTLDQVRNHVETDLVDDALQLLIDAADAEIIRRLGPVAQQVEVLDGGQRFIHLARSASNIVSCVERYSLDNVGILDIPINLHADDDPPNPDLRLHADGIRVERLFTGPVPASKFLGLVTITYTPLDTTAERSILLTKLVKLDLKYEGLMAQSIGDTRLQYETDHAGQRAALFRSLSSSGRRIIS